MSFANDWISWSYDQDPQQKFKLDPQSKMTILVNPVVLGSLKSYPHELLDNMRMIRDSFSGPLDLAFSGGGDSELALRCFHQLGIPVNVVTFRYNDNLNYYDLKRSQIICQSLGIKQTIVDLDLKRYYENDAYDIWTTGYYLNAGRLVHMKMLQYMDNTPLFCDGITQSAFAVAKRQDSWSVTVQEISLSLANYANRISRPMVSCVFDFSPRPLSAWLRLPKIAMLLCNNLDHVDDYSVIKYELLNTLYPEIVVRNKATGFEGTMPAGLDSSRPPYMIEFNNQHIYSNTAGSRQYKIAHSQVQYTYHDLLQMTGAVAC